MQSIFLLNPITKSAQAWVKEYLPKDALTFGGAIVVEHRFIEDVYRALIRDGLIIGQDFQIR